MSIPELWEMSILGQQLVYTDELIYPVNFQTQKFFYIGLENIQGNTGELSGVPHVLGSKIKSTKRKFHPGSILYGKLRPYLNKVHLAETEGICSTDIWVLKSRPTINSEFATYYLRSAAVLSRVSQLAVGANLPRIDSNSFSSIPIPLPPLPEQERIVTILRQADELRRLRAQANRRMNDLLPALFQEMFGDPVTNTRGWEKTSLGRLLVEAPQNGLYKHSSYYGSGTPIVRIRVRPRKGASFSVHWNGIPRLGYLPRNPPLRLPQIWDAPSELLTFMKGG